MNETKCLQTRHKTASCSPYKRHQLAKEAFSSPPSCSDVWQRRSLQKQKSFGCASKVQSLTHFFGRWGGGCKQRLTATTATRDKNLKINSHIWATCFSKEIPPRDESWQRTWRSLIILRKGGGRHDTKCKNQKVSHLITNQILGNKGYFLFFNSVTLFWTLGASLWSYPPQIIIHSPAMLWGICRLLLFNSA